MSVLLKNNAVSRLASSLTAGATSLSVTTGQGGKFPNPSVGNWFPVTLIKASGALEIVRCTSRSGDVLTVVRAQEGTAAQSFSAGDRAELRLTAAAVIDIQQSITDLSNSALLDANNLADLADKGVSRNNLGLGTAATRNVQVSPYDSTPDLIMVAGSFGLGSTAMPTVSDLDAVKVAGLYSINTPTSGSPGFGFGTLLVLPRGPTEVIQIAHSATDTQFKFRRSFSGSWFGWQTVFHSGNVSAFIQTLLDDADAAAARATLGAPAGVDAQMCTAWVNFYPGTGAIRSSYNVSSLTSGGTGIWRANFTTPMANANYNIVGIGDRTTGIRTASVYRDGNVTPTVNGADVRICESSNGGNINSDYANIAVFGGK